MFHEHAYVKYLFLAIGDSITAVNILLYSSFECVAAQTSFGISLLAARYCRSYYWLAKQQPLTTSMSVSTYCLLHNGKLVL